MGKNCESKSLLLTINQPMNGVAKQLSDHPGNYRSGGLRLISRLNIFQLKGVILIRSETSVNYYLPAQSYKTPDACDNPEM